MTIIEINHNDGIDMKNFLVCSTDGGSSGSTIFNILNYKIIGIHKGEHKKFQFKVCTVLNYQLMYFLLIELIRLKNLLKKK